MFLKPVWNDQTYALNINDIQSTTELFSLLRKIYTNLPDDFILRVPTSTEEIFIQQSSDLNQVRPLLFNRCRAYIELKNQKNAEACNQNIIQRQQVFEKFEIKEAKQQDSQSQKQSKNEVNEDIPLVQAEGKEQQNQIQFFCCLCQSEIKSEIMYRCSVCEDMDVCQECEDNFEHTHPFVKIRDRGQRYLKVFAVVKSQLENVSLDVDKQKIKQGKKQNQKTQSSQMQQDKNKSFFHNIKQKISTFRLRRKLWNF